MKPRKEGGKSTAEAIEVNLPPHIDDLGKAWGKHMRSSPNGYDRTNPIVRFGDVGSGHNYVRSAHTSDSITSGTQRNHTPTRGGGKLNFGTDSWQIAGSSPSSSFAQFRQNLFDMRIKNKRIIKATIPISRLMNADLQWFHRAWKQLPIRFQSIIWTHYIYEVDVNDEESPINHAHRVELLNTSNDFYWRWLKVAQQALHYRIGVLQLNAIPSKPVRKLNQTKEQGAPLWAGRIYAWIHKLPIRCSNPPPRIIPDDHCYFRRGDGVTYSVLSARFVKRLRRRSELHSYLREQREKADCLCHFPKQKYEPQGAREKYNSNKRLNEWGLTNLDSCLGQWCQQLNEAKAPGRRTINGCFPL